MNAGIEELRSIVGSREDRVIRARRAAEWVRAAGDYHWIGIYDVDDSNISAIAWTGSMPPRIQRLLARRDSTEWRWRVENRWSSRTCTPIRAT